MKFSPNAGITCGTKHRHSFASQFNSEVITDNQGTFHGMPFWFCSDDCIFAALESFIDKRYHRYRTAYDDPDLPSDHIEEFIERWNANLLSAWEDAHTKLAYRAVGEFGDQVDKEHQQVVEYIAKETIKREFDKQKQLDRVARIERQEYRDKQWEIDRQEKKSGNSSLTSSTSNASTRT